jgi:hypothetical protein
VDKSSEDSGSSNTSLVDSTPHQAAVVLHKSCPNPGCLPILDQARAYVRQKLEGRFLPCYAALGETEAYHTARHAIAAALAAGDLDATKEACRQWCRLVIAWTRDHAASGEAVVP